MNPRAPGLDVALLLFFTVGGFAEAQCAPEWSSAAAEPHLAGSASCSVLWDPDGAGAAPQRFVVGGAALVGGSAAAAQRLMTFDGAQWQALGNGPGTMGKVDALTTWNGLLVAGGTFTGGGLNHIALWDGAAWQPLGPGLPFSPTVLAEWNGNLVAGEIGTNIPIHSWNGATWTPLPLPPSLTNLHAMTAFQGLLCAAGHVSANGTGALERWNGTAWASTIAASSTITSLAVRSFSLVTNLYAAGSFSSIGGTTADRVATTSGGSFSWTAVGSGLAAGQVQALHVRATSAIGSAVVAATGGTTSASPAVQQLSGGTFVPLGTLPTALSWFESLQYFGGAYHGVLVGFGVPDPCVRYDGLSWAPIAGQGIDGEVHAIASNGANVIVGGSIQATSGTALNRIARWNGTTFQPLGTGMGGTSVDALLTLDNGDIVAGGVFPTAGGLGVNNIARWNGATWSGFGTGCNLAVAALCKLPNGDVVAGGKFTTAGGVACSRIARWNGTAWAPFGFGMNADVLALAVQSDGSLFAGGAFTAAGALSCNGIARWNGTSWQPLGAGLNGDVHALAVRPDGDVVAAGAFTTAGGVAADRCARWNGSAWSTMGAASGDTGPARSLCVLPNGDVVAGRGFHQPTGTPDAGISRWNGTSWSGFDSGVAASLAGQSVTVRAIAQRADGTLIVGGDFGVAGGFATNGFAKLTPTCPASATQYGVGCSSIAGSLAITATTLPWIGATFRTTTTGMAAGSLGVGSIGLTQLNLSLPALLPEGQPGCSLLTSLDIVLLLANGPANTATSSFGFANDPVLVGVPFFQQTIPFEFDLNGALVAVRGSNALSLVIGTL